MKWLFRLIKKLLFLIILILIVVVLARNFIVKTGATVAAKVATGLDLAVEDVKIGLGDTDIGLKGIQLQNPKGFLDERMVDIPEVYINYNLFDFFKDNIHVEEIRLNLNELVIAKNKEGKLNIKELLLPEKDEPDETDKSEESQDPDTPQKDKNKREINIDSLKLKIGTVIYKDFSVVPPKITEFNINIDEEIKNVNTKSLAAYITGKALMNTTIGQLANINLDDLTGQAKDIANEMLKNVDTENLDDTIDDLGNKAKDALKSLGF